MVGSLACLLVCVLAAPQEFTIDTDRIYTPDDLRELQIAIAYEKCVNTPGCDTSIYSYVHEQAQCQEGAGVDSLMTDVIGVRSGVGGGCNPLVGDVLWPSTGQCVTLLSQGPCPQGQWVKLDSQTLEPKCAYRPCGQNSVVWHGQCRTLPTLPRTSCPPSQKMIVNEFGDAECDCIPGLVYYEGTRKCYTPYTQGPCLPGHVIQVVDVGISGRTECIPNPCPEPNMVRLDQKCRVRNSGAETSCHVLDTAGPCSSSTRLRIDEAFSEPLCITTHSIFSTIGPRCSRGSIRDNRGRCRTNFAKLIRNGPPLVTSRPRPQGNRICPIGQVFMAGICLRLAF